MNLVPSLSIDIYCLSRLLKFPKLIHTKKTALIIYIIANNRDNVIKKSFYEQELLKAKHADVYLVKCVKKLL